RKTERKRQQRYPQNPGVARRLGHRITRDNWIFHGSSYKKIYLFAKYLNCGSPRLRQRIKPRFLLYYRDEQRVVRFERMFNSLTKTGRSR
ncbi:MAG: hypothetical protein WAK55_03060, partial [Xanthobacteraceae bacterium]